MKKKKVAKLRGIYSVEGKQIQDINVGDILCQSKRKRLERYRKIALKCGHDLVADLSTNPDERPGRAGIVLPTVTRTTRLVKVSACPTEDALFTMNELNFLHGWPVLAAVVSKQRWKKCMPFDPNLLPLKVQKRMCGNGQHLAAMGAWFLYLMAHLVRRDRPLCLPTLPTTPREREEHDDTESEVDDDDDDVDCTESDEA